MAFGSGAVASQTNAIAFGTNAQATGVNAIAIGNGAVATGSVAVGNNASAANGGAAFGDNATATGSNSTAAGPGATATHANAAAFGNGAATTRANQQVYGTIAHSHTMPGITSAASRAAQSGPTQVVTSDANGNLATSTPSGLGLASTSDIAALHSQIGNSQREARAGTALALAASGLQYDTRPGKASLAGAFGNYKGQSGLAVGLGYAHSDRIRFNAAFTGSPQVGDYGVVTGASFTLN